MKQEVKKDKDIVSIAALLTEDNKHYVIAVAEALLFAQKQSEKGVFDKGGGNIGLCESLQRLTGVNRMQRKIRITSKAPHF